ncbi:replication-associated protein [McMurdo Ice Shelf pond-associated circular DNA virus-2]|uniref:replication-associated protein n=1 Tax=McMurdo Ice Shelf pond-associated circular DNA virus-2 TaxID=1521386 RepID=UPI0004D189EC|nr:replication-associated protein [McMurdo Ice Shelf pond-associated circular DNA virus-2]AIF71504.1 replication-associated protein [McMurdo Ice Shelf pond-associated circular DNA virus-2]
MVNARCVCVTIHVDNIFWELQKWNQSLTYGIGQLELGLNGSTHWQMYFENNTAISLTQWKQLLGCKRAHVETRKGTALLAIEYCKKEETRLHGPGTSFEFGKTTEESVKRKSPDSPYKKALNCLSYADSIAIIKDEAPRDYVIYHNQVTSTLKAIFKPVWNKTPGLVFNLEPFPEETLNTRAVIFMGRSGLGKTQFAISHFKDPLIVSHIDDLKKLNPTIDGIIFDDMNFQHWPPTACIHLCDMELPRSINVKYGTVEIPANTPRIFTSNRDFEEIWSKDCTFEEMNAIRRRCDITTFDNELY